MSSELRRAECVLAGAVLVSSLTLAACVSNQQAPSADYPAYTMDAGFALTCVPNLDGQIDADEMQPQAGIPEQWLVSPQEPVDLDPAMNAAGALLWDWSEPNPADESATILATTLAGKWYANSFPTGQYAAPLDMADTVEGVYVHTDAAIEFLGYASTTENPSTGQTLVVYDSPVALYQFPIMAGSSWTVVGTSRNGLVDGLAWASTDTYVASVDEVGILDLPSLTFTQAMRMHLTTTVAPAVGENVTTRVVSFLFQCFGEVARATSLPNETEDDFTTAAEVRRLGFSGDTP